MAGEIAQIDNRPWIPRPIPVWLQEELTRRKNDIGINYINNSNAAADDRQSWKSYRGPMAPWVRICSNGTGENKFLKKLTRQEDNLKGGFVFYGGQGFKDTFGLETGKNILGYTVTGTPITLPIQGSGFNYYTTVENSDGTPNNRLIQPFLPPPGIESVEAMVQKELIREVKIKWSCYGSAQLEYLTPYFLTPGISAIVEFGWNNFNPQSLLPLDMDTKKKYMVLNKKGHERPYQYKSEKSGSIPTEQLGLLELWSDGNPLYDCNIRKSHGLYDVTFGTITNFEFSTTNGIKWDCTTTIGSKHRNFSGFPMNNSRTEEDTKAKGGASPNGTAQTMTFPQFIKTRLKNVKTCLTDNKNFFDALDTKEIEFFGKNGIGFTKKFYNGQAENRIFIGRTSNIDNLDNKTATGWMGKQYKDDWDYDPNDNVWVTMGFLMELFNFFFTTPSKMKDSTGESFQFYKINPNGQTIIGAHPNLISADGGVCLIPNRKAPKYNKPAINRDTAGFLQLSTNRDLFSQQKYGNSKNIFHTSNTKFTECYDFNTKSVRTGSYNTYNGLNYADTKLISTFKTGIQGAWTALRDDLDSVINRYRYYPHKSGIESTSTNIPAGNDQGSLVRILNTNTNNTQLSPLATPGTYSFPQWKPLKSPEKFEGTYGYLEDIFINCKFIMDTVDTCKTTGEFYTKLLEALNASVNGFWDLKIIEGNEYIEIIDQKFLSMQELENVDVFQFDVSAANNCIKGIAFTSTISNIQANQVIAASSNNAGKGENSTSQPIGFVVGDRFFGEAQAEPSIIFNKLPVEQLQTSGKNELTYTMTFNYDDSNMNIVNLVLPDKALLAAILDDGDYYNNSNVYGGQQPNFTLEFEIQGLSGFRTFQCISFKNFPRPYSDQEVIFQIVDVTHTVTDSNWTTRIKAGIRPLRYYGKLRINYVDGSNLL